MNTGEETADSIIADPELPLEERLDLLYFAYISWG
jgi:hypothetical protein